MEILSVLACPCRRFDRKDGKWWKIERMMPKKLFSDEKGTEKDMLLEGRIANSVKHWNKDAFGISANGCLVVFFLWHIKNRRLFNVNLCLYIYTYICWKDRFVLNLTVLLKYVESRINQTLKIKFRCGIFLSGFISSSRSSSRPEDKINPERNITYLNLS